MPKREITHEEVLNYLKNLPYSQFKDLVEYYSSNHKADFQKEMDNMIKLNLQDRLESLGVNSICPKCNSRKILKNGHKRGIQMFICSDCNAQFNLFTGTVLEKTKWHWDIWINVLHMTLNNYSIHKMINVLEKDYGCYGINYKTVWLWRIKLIHAMAQVPMPILSGIVQIDETFIRESQKGSRHLVTYVGDNRMPRYGRRPSKYGVMGSEFATVCTAIDNTGHCVCKVVGLGKMDRGIFMDLFEPHLDNPAYICSDANSLYSDYCKTRNIVHYERPSNYLKTIEDNGYKQPIHSDPRKLKNIESNNHKILKKLYNENLTDKITNRGRLSYEQFNELKTANNLSLARVNELHAEIKKFIYESMTNVSTKYLNDYIGFFTYLRNYKVDYDTYPSSKKDAEEVFIDILLSKSNLTINDIHKKELDLPTPSGSYISALKNRTMIARNATKNRYFKFDPEDGLTSFNMREYLTDRPITTLHKLCKSFGLTRYKN